MNLQATVAIFAGGPGSGCQGPSCGRPETGRAKDLSQLAIKREVERLIPLLQKTGEVWSKAIKKLDRKANFSVHVAPTGLFQQKNLNTPMVLKSTWGVNLFVNGKTSGGEHFMMGFGLFPEPGGNTIKMQDSSLPDSWIGKGLFSSAVGYVKSNMDFGLSNKMLVHMDTNPKAWKSIAKKFGFNYENSR